MSEFKTDHFSVLSSTFDGESTTNLEKYFRSIHQQTLHPTLVVLCLDGYIRTELLDIVHRYSKILNIKLIQNKKIGLSKNLNIGLDHCVGNYVIRCDTDDEFEVTRFEKQINLLKKHKYAVVSANAIELKEHSRRLKRVPIGEISRRSLYAYFRNPVNHHTCAFILSIVRNYKYPNGRMEDYRLWIRLLSEGYLIFNTDESLSFVNADNLEKRRSGNDYISAEFELLKLNFGRSMPFSFIYASIAFLLRVPLRLEVSRPILRMMLSLTRRRID